MGNAANYVTSTHDALKYVNGRRRASMYVRRRASTLLKAMDYNKALTDADVRTSSYVNVRCVNSP